MQSPMSTTVQARTGGVATLALLLGAAVSAQGEPERALETPKSIRKKAMRLIRLLELPHRRAEAAPKLLALGAKAVPSLVLALDDPRPEVVAQLALVVRALGENARPTVPILRKLAKEKDPKLAYAAQWALAAFEPQGITVISEGAGGGVVKELDEKGKELFRLKDSTNAYDAERLPNGNYLICILNQGLVKEVDRKGKNLWSYKELKTPSSATRLPSGNTLIASVGDNTVVEVTPAGKTVWKHGCKTPYSVSRLANGNTLIADYGRNEVFEVSPEGKEMWSCKRARGPLEAQRLSNGNTLITSHTSKAVYEVTPKGKTVLELKLPNAGWCACRLADGRTLVGGGNFMACFDAKGKQLWQRKNTRLVTSVQHY